VTDDQRLLDHYVARGREAWNTSTDAAWLDFTLRDWVEALVPARAPRIVCNVGIGVGLWDDWLGHLLGRRDHLVSVDKDLDVCRTFALRQAREQHPLLAQVVCGDLLAGVLPGGMFDLITVVGSTLDEVGAARRGDAITALVHALAPRGRLVLAELADVVAAPLPPGVAVACRRHARRGELALSLVAIDRDVSAREALTGTS
jgi:hypothetical protein